jgi:hypothetical protein
VYSSTHALNRCSEERKTGKTEMNTFEQTSLKHAAAELAYQRSPQAAIDLRAGKLARAAADRKAGHTPQCTLMRCAKNCPSINHKVAA